MDKLLIPFSDQPWDRLGIGRTTFYDLVNAGRISTVHIGRRRLVHTDELITRNPIRILDEDGNDTGRTVAWKRRRKAKGNAA